MEYMLEFIDMSGQEAADIQSDKETAEKLLNDAVMGGWEVVSLVPFAAEKPNQFLALLKKPKSN